MTDEAYWAMVEHIDSLTDITDRMGSRVNSLAAGGLRLSVSVEILGEAGILQVERIDQLGARLAALEQRIGALEVRGGGALSGMSDPFAEEEEDGTA